MSDQNQYRDDQSFDVDIDKVYQSFISEIDNLRSVEDTNLTESRCSAFYRLIGLPVCDGTSLYCPGMDKPNNNDTDKNQTKLNISNNIKKNTAMIVLLNAREDLPRDHLSIFSLQDVNATLLALSSVDIREFSAPFKNSDDPFNTEIPNQQHIVEIIKDLSNNVKNTNGEVATNYNSVRRHIIRPLLVNPFIDNNVKPAKNRLAVPFLKDKSETKLNNNDYLKRPYIEKVCRDRFGNSNNISNSGSYIADIIVSIQNNSAISDDSLIKSLNADNITSEQVQFANYINIIRSMLNKLSEAVDNVAYVLATDPNNNGHAQYNWYPIPNKNGPEKGCTTRDLSEQPNDPSNTKLENSIIELQFKQELKNISNKLQEVKKIDLGGFVFDNHEITPDSNSSDVYGNTLTSPIESGLKNRTEITNLANDGLKHIEIITGEFSGLGLCDILAICTALWIVDKEVLLNMLDKTAQERMFDDPNLKVSSFTIDISGSIKKFDQKVKEVFELMDKLYKDIRSENKQ